MKIFTIALLLLASLTLFAQVPQKMTYQAIVRDADGYLVENSNIGMQISIIEDGQSGVVVYVERHFPTTNENGLVTLEIGTGTTINGNFPDIQWSENSFFIKTEIDLLGGSNYTITGNSQILSVPYAFHSLTTEAGGTVDTLYIEETITYKDTIWVYQVDSVYSEMTIFVEDTTQTNNTNIDALIQQLNARIDSLIQVVRFKK